MPLTRDQRVAVIILEWLLDPASHQDPEEDFRRSGRTTAMAIALIRLALRYPGRRIFYTDHIVSASSATSSAHRICHDQIAYWVNHDPTLRLMSWTLNSRNFSCEYPSETIVTSANIPWPPYNWWPSNELLRQTAAELGQTPGNYCWSAIMEEVGITGVVQDVASRSCEAPYNCGRTVSVCLPCRARASLSDPKAWKSPPEPAPKRQSAWERLVGESDPFSENLPDDHEDPA